MAGGARTGALVRSIEAMTTRAIGAHADSRDRYGQQSLGELDVQFHLPVSGTAAAAPQLSTAEVQFDAPFLDAYDERQSPYEDPTFTYGLYLKQGGGDVFFSVFVRQWVVADGFYSGAVVGVSAYAPDGGTHKFDGEIHLNFQGYGAPEGDESDEGDSP